MKLRKHLACLLAIFVLTLLPAVGPACGGDDDDDSSDEDLAESDDDDDDTSSDDDADDDDADDDDADDDDADDDDDTADDDTVDDDSGDDDDTSSAKSCTELAVDLFGVYGCRSNSSYVEYVDLYCDWADNEGETVLFDYVECLQSLVDDCGDYANGNELLNDGVKACNVEVGIGT